MFVEQLWAEWGRNLRKARRAADRTQVDLSAAVRISQTRLSTLERGRGPFRDEVKLALAGELGVRVEELFPFSLDNSGESAA